MQTMYLNQGKSMYWFLQQDLTMKQLSPKQKQCINFYWAVVQLKYRALVTSGALNRQLEIFISKLQGQFLVNFRKQWWIQCLRICELKPKKKRLKAKQEKKTYHENDFVNAKKSEGKCSARITWTSAQAARRGALWKGGGSFVSKDFEHISSNNLLASPECLKVISLPKIVHLL